MVGGFNGKMGPDGRRLVWSLDALGKAIYRLLWTRRTNPPARRSYCAGPHPHRSVLQGILAKRIIQHRLRCNNLSHSMTKWDIRNAFPSPTHSSLDDYTYRTSHPDDAELMCHRHRRARLYILGLSLIHI